MGADDRQSMLQGPIRIGRNVGLGVDVLVLPGARIGPDSFVRPRTTVVGEWSENAILEGDPVRRSGSRFPELARPRRSMKLARAAAYPVQVPSADWSDEQLRYRMGCSAPYQTPSSVWRPS